jgi:hypothetical protein
VSDDVLIQPDNGSALTFSRIAEQNLPSELVLQFVAAEASFRFTERPARREVGPKPTTISTKKDTIRIPLGMTVNKGQTYISNALYRETEARDRVTYSLPWQHAIEVQVANVHTLPDGDDELTVKVVRADREPNRIVTIQAERLHTAQDYIGVADSGTYAPSFVAAEPVTGTLAGTLAGIAGAFVGEIESAEGALAGDVTTYITASFAGTVESIPRLLEDGSSQRSLEDGSARNLEN